MKLSIQEEGEMLDKLGTIEREMIMFQSLDYSGGWFGFVKPGYSDA
jgi:hypothetical protein